MSSLGSSDKSSVDSELSEYELEVDDEDVDNNSEALKAGLEELDLNKFAYR